MQGTERRSYQPGRRASDRTARGHMPWVRVLMLAIALVITAYALLVIRDDGRPDREAQAIKVEALALEARLAASQITARLALTDRALALVARELAERPAQAVEALDRARVVAPDAAFVIADKDGRVLAATGGKTGPEAATAGRASSAYALHDGALTARRPLADGRTITARTPLPDLKTALPGAGLSIVPAGQAPADAGRPVKGADGQVRLTASAPVDAAGHAVVAAMPATGGLAAWLDDAWMLAGPLLLVLLMLAVLAVQNWRQTRAGRHWADTERRFRVAVEAARCGVWEWDLARGEVVLSDYMAAMLEVEPGQALTTQTLIEKVHPRYRETLIDALDRAAADGVFDVTFPVPLKGGGVRWIDARGQSRQPRRDAGFTNLLGVALDITEARRSKAQAQAAENRLRDGIESVSDAFVPVSYTHLTLPTN